MLRKGCKMASKDEDYKEREEWNENPGVDSSEYLHAGSKVREESGESVRETPGAAAYLQNAVTDDARRMETAKPDPRIPAGGGHTEEEYFTLPDDLRVELIDGVFYAMASPARIHQTVAIEIVRQLWDCIEKYGKECYAYIAPSDVALGEDRKTVVQPDVYVHCNTEKDSAPGPYRGAPAFVLEVLSPSNPENDLWRKRELYRRHGVREYWIVDPREMSVYVFCFEKTVDGDDVPERFTFRDIVPIGISDGSCRIDFTRVYDKIKHFLTKSAENKEIIQESPGAAVYLQNAVMDDVRRMENAKPDPRIPAGGGNTEEEYFRLPDDLRVELIDGVFYAMASPAKLHQAAALEIARQLWDCIEKHGKKCYVYIAPSDVSLGEDRKTVVQPDVYLHCDSEKETLTGPHRGAPDFVLEVLSPSNPENDLWRKRELYRRHGVREYWIVDPAGQIVYVFDFEKENPDEDTPEKYSFDSQIPIRISGGSCSVDFQRVYRKIEHFFRLDP